ncbi:MAG TPA: response regulator transcription factor [Geobacteraceae bacterium]|nr:response regulator transcription factor [Geobacteraceae bacterium]
MTIRIILADDHLIVRDGMRHLLEKETGIVVVGMADNGRMALQLCRELRPDVVVMDIAMPEMNGIEATRRLAAEMPGIGVLILSMHSARRYIVEALAAGARGYLLKECVSDELVRGIRTVAAHETYLSPKVADQIVKDYMKRLSSDTILPAAVVLSSREREILQLIAEGKNTKEIAFIAGISGKTVETHRQQIMKKLNLYSVAELTRYAIREGLTPLD